MVTVDPSLPFTIRVQPRNLGERAVHDVEIVVRPGSKKIVSVPESCEVLETEIHCHLGSLEPSVPGSNGSSDSVIEIVAVAPEEHDGSSFFTQATISSPRTDPNPENNHVVAEVETYRTFYVTSLLNEGLGTLRSAIETANSECHGEPRCKIAFRVEPGPEERWVTVSLEDALPDVVATNVWIDGETQTLFYGDLNPEGPEVEVNGNAIESGSGFVLSGTCWSRVSGFAINGFPENGVRLAPTVRCGQSYHHRIVKANFIGSSPDGKTARPNLRGVFVDIIPPDGERLWLSDRLTTISDNVISGNHRSGIFFQSGAGEVRGNLIGLTGDGTAPLSNGASGIYFGPDSNHSTVVGNHIAFNHHFGIAVGSFAQAIGIYGNSIHANWQRGIDYGLDGELTVDSFRPPVILDARFDAATGETVIDGFIPGWKTGTSLRYVVYLFANDQPDRSGYGEGQYFLGSVKSEDGSFVFRYPADLRGKWATSTVVERDYICLLADECEWASTSEFGANLLITD